MSTPSAERASRLRAREHHDRLRVMIAVRRVADAGSALDPEVVRLLLGRRRREDPLVALSPREREVLGLMAEGRSNSAMADALGVSDSALERHVTAIFPKLDLPAAVADHQRILPS
jgi:DNA-binding NarL/FixJ family response regulator